MPYNAPVNVTCLQAHLSILLHETQLFVQSILWKQNCTHNYLHPSIFFLMLFPSTTPFHTGIPSTTSFYTDTQSTASSYIDTQALLQPTCTHPILISQALYYHTYDQNTASSHNDSPSTTRAGVWHKNNLLNMIMFYIINPRRACTARVTIVVLCVCVCVCVCVCL